MITTAPKERPLPQKVIVYKKLGPIDRLLEWVCMKLLDYLGRKYTK